MLKRLALFVVGVAAAVSIVGCNDDDSSYNTEVTYSSTLVTHFNLKANSKVLASLDTVFFSIDQVGARIFNADSLPYGTDTRKLPVNLTTDMCRVVELTMRMDNGSDSTINYLTNSTDSINFANGPVKLHLESYDGQSQRDYTISVNVHAIVPDSLYWDQIARRDLPSSLAPKAQKAVRMADKAVCLTSDGSGRYCIAFSSDPASDSWTYADPAFGFTPAINSLTATSSLLFILSDDGSLYSSADGKAWSKCYHPSKLTAIIGAYGPTLLCVSKNGGAYYHTTYPSANTPDKPVAADFPVSDHSTPVIVGTRWAEAEQMVVVGGRLADGSLSRSTWGFDGTAWARIGSKFPTPIAKASVLAYDVAVTDTASWTVTEMPALIAFGGLKAESTLSSLTYISRDMGMSWKQADNLLQLPSYIAPRSGAQPLVFESTLPEGRSAFEGWQWHAPKPLPGWWQVVEAASRAVAPITQWQCPYIYLFGGEDANGNLYNDVWKGVINRLTFKPLQ